MTATPTTAARLVRQARSGAGLTQAELARRVGMPRSVVNAYEHGTRDPGVEALVRLVGAAGGQVLVRPAPPIDVERNADILEQVLDLADALPTRRRGRLAFPPLTSLPTPSPSTTR